MSTVNLVLWAAGAVLVVLAYARGAPYYRRAQALRAQTENIRRYESWRGHPAERGSSSADLMAAELRRRTQVWVAVGAVGVVLVIAGFAIR